MAVAETTCTVLLRSLCQT